VDHCSMLAVGVRTFVGVCCKFWNKRTWWRTWWILHINFKACVSH
jgi:hypothetical protein